MPQLEAWNRRNASMCRQSLDIQPHMLESTEAIHCTDVNASKQSHILEGGQ